MPYIALTNQETTPKRLQQTDAKEIHNGSSPQGTAAKVYKNKKNPKQNINPTCSNLLAVQVLSLHQHTLQNPVKLHCPPQGRS